MREVLTCIGHAVFNIDTSLPIDLVVIMHPVRIVPRPIISPSKRSMVEYVTQRSRKSFAYIEVVAFRSAI